MHRLVLVCYLSHFCCSNLFSLHPHIKSQLSSQRYPLYHNPVSPHLPSHQLVRIAPLLVNVALPIQFRVDVSVVLSSPPSFLFRQTVGCFASPLNISENVQPARLIIHTLGWRFVRVVQGWMGE